jgi:L-glyceraldehyde 3-phosphate reductase
VVAQAGALIAAGKLRAWGLLNWPAGLLAEAGRSAAAQGVPAPAAVQLPYSLVRRSPVEDADVAEALGASEASVVASAVLAGGALSGKYAARGQAEGVGDAGAGRLAEGGDAAGAGRLAAQRDDPALAPAFAAAADLRALAADLDTAPAALAIAFALSQDSVASVLFGATSPAQIAENVAALDLLDRLGDGDLARLRAIGA